MGNFRSISLVEKRFMSSKKILSSSLKPLEKVKEQESVFVNFVKEVKANKEPISLALEKKITAIIKDHKDPVVAAKLIVELIWVTRREL